MSDNTGLMGGLYTISEWIMKFAVTNLVWLLFNSPIVMLLVLGSFVEQLEEIIFLVVPMILLLPLLFFPATIAMFALVRGWISKDEDSGHILMTFWGYYKENYKRSVASGFIFTGAWMIWVIDLYYFLGNNTFMTLLFITLGILLFVFTINYFSITVHYQLKLLPSYKKTFLITIGSPLLFLAVAISSGVVLYTSLNIFKFFLPFLTGSLIAYLSFSAFYRNYLSLLRKNSS